MAAITDCPDCGVTLEDRDTEVRCWRCGWEVRDVDNGPLYREIAEALAELD